MRGPAKYDLDGLEYQWTPEERYVLSYVSSTVNQLRGVWADPFCIIGQLKDAPERVKAEAIMHRWREEWEVRKREWE